MASTAKQIPLPFEPGWEKTKALPIFDDPAFMDNRTAPVHRWVPWIAGFSGAFVDSVLARYLNNKKKSGFILDPFAGVGTTLVQAAVRGYRVVGFEINPYSKSSRKCQVKCYRIRHPRA
jgi:hypothetical protein